ncbi:MAG: hypothetical protein QFE16_06765 [Pseudomonadota bacterium]|nr:hypothetical protein [Pseudomonadota bacterium]
MFLLVEGPCARPSRRPGAGALAAVSLASAVLCVSLSACTSFRSGHEPVPVVEAASAPVVVVVPPLATEAASAPPAASAASAPVDPATPGDLASRQLLAYHDQVRALAPNDLAQEINRLAALPVIPETALELALALMQTRNGGELGRAIGLVEPVVKGTSADLRPWQPFARLLMSRLLELRRLEDLLDKRNQELRDSQREVRQLNEKLEALKAIERSLAPRPSSSSSPAAVSGAASFAPASQATPPNRRNP